MDPYSSDGHDGFVENGEIINDKTLPIHQNVYRSSRFNDIIGPSDSDGW